MHCIFFSRQEAGNGNAFRPENLFVRHETTPRRIDHLRILAFFFEDMYYTGLMSSKWFVHADEFLNNKTITLATIQYQDYS